MEISQQPPAPGRGECRLCTGALSTGAYSVDSRVRWETMAFPKFAPGSGEGQLQSAPAALAHPHRAPLSPRPAPAASLSFLVTQWLNNFRRLALCTQLQLFKSSEGSKL